MNAMSPSELAPEGLFDSSVKPRPALLLLAHGARDPNWRTPFDTVLARVRSQTGQAQQVEQAFLEHMQPTFQEAVDNIYRSGVRQILVVPLFLGVGGHVRLDVPRLVAEAQLSHPDLDITVKAPMAENESVLAALVGYCVA